MPGSRPEPAAGPGRDDALRTLALGCLKSGWSPEQVGGRLRQQQATTTISHERIYRFICAQIRRIPNYDWRHYLPRAKFKRGCRGDKGGSPIQHTKDRVSIGKRPIYINARRQPGHWETDYLLFSRYGQSVLVAQERASRFVLLAKPPSRQAQPTAAQLHSWLSPLPPQLCRTLTQDNGTEFALYHKLRDVLGINTYFCNPHSPGKRAASKTPTVVSTDFCRVEQTCSSARRGRSTPSLDDATMPRASALVAKPQPSYSTITCCT
jgi:IS30 family transposase